MSRCMPEITSQLGDGSPVEICRFALGACCMLAANIPAFSTKFLRKCQAVLRTGDVTLTVTRSSIKHWQSCPFDFVGQISSSTGTCHVGSASVARSTRQPV